MRALLLSPLLLLCLPTAWAAAATAPPPPVDQHIQRIEVQDKDVLVHELRVGGETQTITVQPTNGLPAYEVVPANGARQHRIDERDGAGSGSVGQRVWTLRNF
jgi:hypothetical protein